MLWLLVGCALLGLFLVSLRAFERASVSSLHGLLHWSVALAGLLISFGLVISGRGPLALAGLVLVGPWLWRQWQLLQPGAPVSPMGAGPMTRAEAYAVLGLQAGASEQEIRLAYTRLMRAAHPDAGGSDWLASRINQARDILLG